jgi:hypothetical protein
VVSLAAQQGVAQTSSWLTFLRTDKDKAVDEAIRANILAAGCGRSRPFAGLRQQQLRILRRDHYARETSFEEA